MYDVPAFIDKILEETNKEKVTYIGYSQGTAQMFYALSKLEDSYFADRINRFVAMAPCLMLAEDAESKDAVIYTQTLLKAIGVYSLFSETWD